MKANRKFKEDGEAVSAVIGVILMVAITVAIAATVYVYVSGMLGSGPESSAVVSMTQKNNYILISGVDKGPVTGSTCNVRVLLTTGANATGVVGTLNYDLGSSATNVDPGDTISFAGQTAGTKYTVLLLDGSGDQIGTSEYVPTS